MMYLGNDLIEAVPLNFTKISEPGYLGSFKRTLKQKYGELIQQVSEQPEFLIINPVQKMIGTTSPPQQKHLFS